MQLGNYVFRQEGQPHHGGGATFLRYLSSERARLILRSARKKGWCKRTNRYEREQGNHHNKE